MNQLSVALNKLEQIREALKAGRKVNICIQITEITAIALDGDEDDRVYFNNLGTVVFIDDLEKAKIEVQ
jgi:hypothetical protein